MGHQVTIGGERLGAGKRMKAELHNYERSTHDLSYVWRSTMAAGTLVPFLSELALPGDTFDIDLDCKVLTHPTIGPLFGSYKVQLDVFQIPIRLYNAKLHMNMLGIGLDMSKVHLPQIELVTAPPTQGPIDNQQINPSSLLSYLGIRGNGYNGGLLIENAVTRKWNAVPLLAYWDIYKNYYANKQEEIGAYIHRDVSLAASTITSAFVSVIPTGGDVLTGNVSGAVESTTTLTLGGTNLENFEPTQLIFTVEMEGLGQLQITAAELFSEWQTLPEGAPTIVIGSVPSNEAYLITDWVLVEYTGTDTENPNIEPKVATFPLTNIDDMRFKILQSDPTIDAPFTITSVTPNLTPYISMLQNTAGGTNKYSILSSQEGLGLKTYNSDLLNNWIQTEWIDGVDGISAITAIDTSGGSFTIDELNLSKKIYDMLNRIAISGGTYDDWLDAVYTHDRQRSAENPMYIGGLIKNLVFQEVVSNAQTTDQPLGTLAGRGTMGNKNKGGKIIAKIDEPSYIMGIVSLTPNLDYSQGNKWDMNLRTLNDLHKPALDEIGFQDLITDQMAWWDTEIAADGFSTPIFKSAGKQPAWVNYMTNINQVRGNFADPTQEMFMTLNRQYEAALNVDAEPSIKDLTTYIDPTKFNQIFADTRLDAQNFWTQIGIGIQARRKMSAKIMPNL